MKWLRSIYKEKVPGSTEDPARLQERANKKKEKRKKTGASKKKKTPRYAPPSSPPPSSPFTFLYPPLPELFLAGLCPPQGGRI